jgi:hypothetical protein
MLHTNELLELALRKTSPHNNTINTNTNTTTALTTWTALLSLMLMITLNLLAWILTMELMHQLIVEMTKSTSDGEKKVYKAHPVLKAMVLDDDRTYWFDLGTLQSWCNGGREKY